MHNYFRGQEERLVMMEMMALGDPKENQAPLEMTVTPATMACKVTKVTPAQPETRVRLETGACQEILVPSDPQGPKVPMEGLVFQEQLARKEAQVKMESPVQGDSKEPLGWM